MAHVGVDLHKRTSQIAVLTEDGELTQHRLENDVARVEQFLAHLPPKTPVAIEASGTWWWLVDLLEGLGHQPILSHPKQTRAIAAARLKNDRVDAQRLALLLRGDLLPTVWIPPAALREARELIRYRVQLVWLRGELRNRQVAMLARRNLQPTSGKSWFTTRGQREFERLPLPTVPAASARTTARCSRCSMRTSASSIGRSPSAGETIRACGRGCARFPASAPSLARSWSLSSATSPALPPPSRWPATSA